MYTITSLISVFITPENETNGTDIVLGRGQRAKRCIDPSGPADHLKSRDLCLNAANILAKYNTSNAMF